jgi:DNA-binding NarL/FixJ family response regulator
MHGPEMHGPAVSRTSVFACESQPVAVEGLESILAECDDLEFVGSVSKATEALEALGRVRPDVALIDLAGGLAPALRLISGLRTTSAKSHSVLWVVDLPESEAFRALQLGVRGILKKTLPAHKLIECLREVGKGNIWMDEPQPGPDFLRSREASRLTPREKQIAEQLHITPGTVKVHLMHVFEKTGLKDRLALAVRGRELIGVEEAAEEPVAN